MSPSILLGFNLAHSEMPEGLLRKVTPTEAHLTSSPVKQVGRAHSVSGLHKRYKTDIKLLILSKSIIGYSLAILTSHQQSALKS